MDMERQRKLCAALGNFKAGLDVHGKPVNSSRIAWESREAGWAYQKSYGRQSVDYVSRGGRVVRVND